MPRCPRRRLTATVAPHTEPRRTIAAATVRVSVLATCRSRALLRHFIQQPGLDVVHKPANRNVLGNPRMCFHLLNLLADILLQFAECVERCWDNGSSAGGGMQFR